MSPIETGDLLRIARALGFELSEAEIEEIREQVKHGLASIDRLDELPLTDVEPALGFKLNEPHD